MSYNNKAPTLNRDGRAQLAGKGGGVVPFNTLALHLVVTADTVYNDVSLLEVGNPPLEIR